MYAVSADSRGLDTVVGLLADVVLHPRLTGVCPGRLDSGTLGHWAVCGSTAVGKGPGLLGTWAHLPVSWCSFVGHDDVWERPGA